MSTEGHAESEGEPVPDMPVSALDLLRDALAARPGVLLAWGDERGEAAATIARDAVWETCAWLKEAHGFVRLSGVIGIDTLRYPVAMPGQGGRGTPRFGVIYHLAMRPPAPGRLRLRLFVPEDDPVVRSITAIWPAANFFEREIYDLFGVTFRDHPDLRRIFLAEDWVGHPLRKDVSIGGERVEFTHTAAAISQKRKRAES